MEFMLFPNIKRCVIVLIKFTCSQCVMSCIVYDDAPAIIPFLTQAVVVSGLFFAGWHNIPRAHGRCSVSVDSGCSSWTYAIIRNDIGWCFCGRPTICSSSLTCIERTKSDFAYGKAYQLIWFIRPIHCITGLRVCNTGSDHKYILCIVCVNE